jgi:hypothetical protein
MFSFPSSVSSIFANKFFLKQSIVMTGCFGLYFGSMTFNFSLQEEEWTTFSYAGSFSGHELR